MENIFSIFWEVGKVGKGCQFSFAKIGVCPEPNGNGYQTHRVTSYDLDTPSDALKKQIRPSV